MPLAQLEDPVRALQQALAVVSMAVTTWMRDPQDRVLDGGGMGRFLQEVAVALPVDQAAAVMIGSALAAAAAGSDGDPWMVAVTVLSEFVAGWDFDADAPVAP